MHTRLPQTEDDGPWSDESNTEIMFDFGSGESLCTDSSEILTLEVVEPSKDHLDDALELNRQLHASLQRKQKEISALKEKNAQLKELAKQAEQYATILDVLMPQPVKGCVSHPASSIEPSEWHFTASEGSWVPSVPINTEQQACTQTHGAKRHSGYDSYSSFDHEPYSKTADHNLYSQSYDHEVYSNSVNSSAVEYSVNGENPDPKRLKLDHYHLQLDYKDLTPQTEQVYLKSTEDSPSNKTNHCTLNTEMIQVYGSFHGLKVVMARRSMTSDLSEHGKEELVCFKTSVREHSTVRTNVFPHGKTFTSHTPDGSCRFLWVPNQN
ncbi:hypothetical protein MHYP_G00188430 [Metynnis hypsauchen]